jgi:hypothetical protein
MKNGDRMSRPKQLCRLEKGGSQIVFLLTDMESGAFELKLIRSDTSGREVRSFRIREDAIVEVRPQVSNYVAHGWAIDIDRR